jgi:restriction endonuclease S subunit
MVDEEIKEIIDLFKEFQKDTGKYLDFDIEKIKFDVKNIGDIIDDFIKGSTPKYSESKTSVIVIKSGQAKGNYNNFDFTKTRYLDVSKVKNIKYLTKGDILINTTGTGTAGRVTLFDLNGKFVTDSHITTLRFNKNKINKFFLLYFFINIGFKKLESMASGSGGQIELKMDSIKPLKIPIPKSIDQTYTSYKIQEVLVDFIEYFSNKNKQNIEVINNEIIPLIDRFEAAVLPQFFEQSEGICEEFNSFAKRTGYDIKLEEVEFEIKRVQSKNENDLVCSKRMGFTPKRISNGNINWFTISDLGENKELLINTPNTKEKTTLELIKDAVDKKRTGKSEKLIPIKKGDVLASFKLTVDIVKIYNSDIPSYCNEAIDILTPNENILSKYLAYNCMHEYPLYGQKTNNGITLNNDDKEKIKIRIPKDTDKYTSYEQQEIFVKFIERYFTRITEMRKFSQYLINKYKEFTETLIAKTLKV